MNSITIKMRQSAPNSNFDIQTHYLIFLFGMIHFFSNFALKFR